MYYDTRDVVCFVCVVAHMGYMIITTWCMHPLPVFEGTTHATHDGCGVYSLLASVYPRYVHTYACRLVSTRAHHILLRGIHDDGCVFVPLLYHMLVDVA